MQWNVIHVLVLVRGMAKHSFDKEMLTDLEKPIDDLKDLNDQERQALAEWEEFFTNKYVCVGKLVENQS